LSFLPSANLIFKIAESERVNINARLNFSRSLARPSIREVAPYYSYDYTLSTYVVGNPNLKLVYINNYDFRFESYFRSGDNVSLSLFFKDFENHIELVKPSYYTWKNAPEGRAYGAELEGKKYLFRNLELSANVTYVYSLTEITEVNPATGKVVDTISRPMFGQAPYILNGMLSYISDKAGLSASLSYNVQGPRLALVVIGEENPDLYVMPRHLIDFKLFKSIGRYFGVEFKIRNLLNSPVLWAYDHNHFSTVYERHAWGTNYILSIQFNL
jgi:outer membrane receptor protein involved in Fe transport